MVKGIFQGFLLTGIMTAAALSFAAPAEAARDIQGELARKQAAHAALEEKSKELSGQVDDLKQKLVGTAQVLRSAEQNVADGDKKLKLLRSEKNETIDNIYKDNDTLGGLVTAAQKYNRTSTPQMLLLSTPLDAARASLIMKSMIPLIHQQSEGLKAKLSEMARIENDISTQLARQADQYKQLDRQQDDLAKLLRDRQQLYQKNEASRKQQEAEMAKLAKEAKNLEELVDRINAQPKRRQAASRVRLPANIIPPVNGIIRTGFGETDELGGDSEGLTFQARRGATVVTPLAGTVKFAGAFQKYKQILIVEHTGGYHSLIAGLGRIDTVVGATLAAGEPVGIAETSQDDPRIYYELRQGGEPVNPRQLLVAQRKQDKS